MLGNQGFVHQDDAANQVHAEEGADALDSGDVGNVALSTPGFMPTTGNSAPANNTAATYYSSASAPLGAAFSCPELQQATAVQAALGVATAAAQRATGHAAVMHYEVGDATAENMTESDPHRVSRGVSSPTDLDLLGEFREEGTSDVEEPTADVGVCKADHFVADEAEEAVKDFAPLGVKGTPLQEDVIPSDLPSMMRRFQGDNVKASSLDASRVVEKLVAATTKAFPTV
ncbi:hypothetical protein TrCOL_g11839, partial [Triparma columacea]